MRGLIAAFARNTVFANIILLIIFGGGWLAQSYLPRETFPDVPLDIVAVTVIWRGADPEEIEEGICRKIEDAIEGIQGMKRYTTIAHENYAVGQIECRQGVDFDDFKDRVSNAIEAISSFPEDSERPIIEKAIIRVPVMFVSLVSDVVGEAELKELAEDIRDEIRALPPISQVEVAGTRDYEISIEVSEERLREYGLSFEQVTQLVRANCLNLAAGVVRTKGEEIRLRTIGRKYTGEDFADLVLISRPNGDVITLARIAEIKDDFTEDLVRSRFNGRECAVISILKTPDEDTLAIDEAVLDYVRRKRASLPDTLDLSAWARMSPLLEARIALLLRNGFMGLALVFLLLWLFLDIRLSFWVSIGMPVSIMGALMYMWAIGASLNMISLFGLVMMLGIIVDDATVIGEAIYVSRSRGSSALKAVVDGVTEVGLPVVAAVTTTIVAFLPLMFVSGWLGDIIGILPKVVIACLLFSLVECLLIFPAHLSHLPPMAADGSILRAKRAVTGWRSALARTGDVGRRFHRMTNGSLAWIASVFYEPFVRFTLRWRYAALCVALMLGFAVLGLVNSGAVKYVFFPEIDGNSIKAGVEFPNGTPMHVTHQAVLQMEEAIRKVDNQLETASGKPLIENIFSLSGARIDDFGRGEEGPHWGNVRIELLDSAERGIHFRDIITAWRDAIGPVPGATTLSFAGDEIAPPGAPVEVWLQGNGLEELQAASEDLQERLQTYEGVYQIESDFRPGKSELRLALRPEARSLGITVAHLAGQIHAGYYGQEVVRLQRGRNEVRVWVRYPRDDRNQIASLDDVRIRSPYGFEVPLRSVADVRYAPGFATITRVDGLRCIKVTAEVDPKIANANEVVLDLRTRHLTHMAHTYPTVQLSLQGDQENRRESLSSLHTSYPLAILGIVIIIATIFRSYVQPLVILLTVPFGAIGAVLGHLWMGFDFSMISVFGVVALSGIVVNDAIVLIECINNYIAEGMPFYEAVAKAGVRRFRPIFLTTISTVGGLTPLILEKDFQAQMLIPMAISVAAGVAFATTLTLLLVPCLMCILNDIRRLVFRALKGTWPTPE
ncbi:MAG TPA: efflux RND transporter permease subunit, partial [Candidatus Hydrogenedentes bacterium]|nr:efflux RND transporter permease subunit [Candidatus Hydrogenedentota bacterium]